MDVKIVATIAFIAQKGHVFRNCFSLRTTCAPVLTIFIPIIPLPVGHVLQVALVHQVPYDRPQPKLPEPSRHYLVPYDTLVAMQVYTSGVSVDLVKTKHSYCIYQPFYCVSDTCIWYYLVWIWEVYISRIFFYIWVNWILFMNWHKVTRVEVYIKIALIVSFQACQHTCTCICTIIYYIHHSCKFYEDSTHDQKLKCAY